MDPLSIVVGLVVGGLGGALLGGVASGMARGGQPAVAPAAAAEGLGETVDADAIPEAVFVVDRAGRVRWASAFGRGLFGRGVVGAPFVDVLPDWDALSEHRSERWTSANNVDLGEVWSLDARAADGAALPVRVQRAKSVDGWVVVLRDTSAHSRQLERVTKANGRMQTARDDALRESRSKTAYLARVAQSLRTPLNAIMGYGELLDEELKDRELDELCKDVGRINDASSALEIILQTVLDWTELESGRMAVETRTFELVDVVQRSAAEERARIEAGGLALVVEMPDRLQVTGDADRTAQILGHLLRNAAAHTAEGEIRVYARRWDDRIAVSVRDTGSGIEAGQVEELFASFAARGTANETAGTGISLLLAHTFARMMGGDLTVDSQVGKGSTFTLILPAVDENEYAPPMLLD